MKRNKTPLRYPGGKQKLAPFLCEILEKNNLLGGHYVEPYAGGAGVAIELLLTGKVSHIHLNDSSRAIYAFWWAVINDTETLCRRIANASLTVAEWRKQREVLLRPSKSTLLDLGFSLFFLNRVNRSGILSAGLIGGLSQAGEWRMDARFPKKDLIGRIEAIAARKKAITLKNWDAEKFIAQHVPSLPQTALVYCDPPYFHKADRLYLHHYTPDDHARISLVIQNELPRNWVVSYDCAPDILSYYSERKSFLYDLQYSASKVYKGREVFVFSDNLEIPSSSRIYSIDFALKAAGY